MTRSTFWFLAVIAVAGMFITRESHRAEPLTGIDRAFLDWLMANARLPAATAAGIHSSVTLIEIDDSIANGQSRMPLSPLDYASFLHVVAKYDPAVVAILPVLEFEKAPVRTDDILADQALKIPKLLLSVDLGNNPEHPRNPASLPPLAKVTGNAMALFDFPEIVAAPEERLLDLAAATGAAGLPGLAGAPVRDIPLLFRLRNRVVPSFALQTLILYLRLASAEVSVQMGGLVQVGDALRLQINSRGRALLDERLFDGFARLPLDDFTLLATGQPTPETRRIAEGMRGGIVILGRTDSGSRNLKLADGREVSPAEVFAWSAVSLARAPSMRRAGAPWQIGIILIWMLVGTLLMRRPRGTAIFTVGMVLAVYGLVALSLFDAQRLWLPFSLPVGLGVIVVVLLWFAPHATTPAAAAAGAAKPALPPAADGSF